VIERALLSHGQKIVLEQRTKAESDIAVAAASILARQAFIDWLEAESKKLGIRLERGVSPGVKETARKLVEKSGPEVLSQVSKVHFKTAHEVAPDTFSAPRPRAPWRK
jgi:ribonuclease HIII